MSTKISQLPEATILDGTEYITVVQGGVTKKSKVSKIDSSIISNTYPGVGAAQTTVQDKLRQIVNVKDFGAVGDGTSPDLPALAASKSALGSISLIDGGVPTSYKVDDPGSVLQGAFIGADPLAKLFIAGDGNYEKYKDINRLTDVNVRFTDLNFETVFPQSPSLHKKDTFALAHPLRRKTKALICNNTTQVQVLRHQDWPVGDNFYAQPYTATASSVDVTSDYPDSFKGAFVELGAYETVSAYFDAGLTAGPIGVMLRGKDGFTVVYTNGAGSNYNTAYKPLGSAIVGNTANLAWPDLGQGRYTSFAPDRSVWSVTKVSNNKAVIKLNGQAITEPYAPGCGDIFEVGFVCFSGGAFSLSGLTIERRVDAVTGMHCMPELRIFGDSTADARWPGAWSEYVIPYLDNSYGLRVKTVVNYAIAGDTVEGQYAQMQAHGLGSGSHIVLCVGTNNAQGVVWLPTFKDSFAAMLDYIIAAGKKPVVVIPWMWYTQAQTPSGADGQGSANYDLAAPYRMAAERIAAERNALIWNPCTEIANPDPERLITHLFEPGLRDNIHQSVLANQLYAKGICDTIAADISGLPESVEETPAATLMLNGAIAGADLRITYGKDGCATLSGSVVPGQVLDGYAFMYLPRYAVPTRNMSIPALALGATSEVLGSCFVDVDVATKEVRLRKAPATTTKIILAGVPWQTEASAY